jgi:ubiquinone/menaquinone biosynthesis C-methylase UbiE
VRRPDAATARAMKSYYERRAPEYDDWYRGTGMYADLDRPGWHEDVAALERAVAELAPARVLDVACGTGFLTRHLRGPVTGLDQSETMLAIARERVTAARFVRGDGLALPFGDGAFERVFTGHFYGHLQEKERTAFLAEAGRVARELVVADAARREGIPEVGWQDRVLSDGSRHHVFKRYFTGEGLARELGGGEVLHEGPWFVVVRAGLPGDRSRFTRAVHG